MSYTFKHGDRPLEGLTVQRAIGRGGFGEVYYALTDSGKQVALKYLRENPEIELRGIAHVMNLKSPHLITIYDVKRNAAGEPFVVMEYVSGPSLRELLVAEPGGMGPQKAAFFLAGIAKGLAYLHERGIVHRDLKPANIFYDDGYVKIGDYGLSKHMSVSQHSGQTVSVGTVHYMAPEIGSGSYTKAIDIYALGVILYEMLTGRLPYSGSSMGEILMRHLRDNPDLSGIPAPFARVIAKALAKEPQDRYPDAEAMLAAVSECADISRSLASFDATSLTRVPRRPELLDPDQTVTAGLVRPPPAPPLDVREAPVNPAGALPPRLQQRLEQLTRKLEQKTARMERKHGRRAGAAPRPAPPERVEQPVRRVKRGAQTVVLLAVTAAIAFALSAPFENAGGPLDARVVATILMMLGAVVGPLLAHLWLLQRAPARSKIIDRLTYASLGGLFMLPGWALAQDEVRGLEPIILGPLAAMLICSWESRIDSGRAGKVNGWWAFWPAVVGLVTAHIAGVPEEYDWVAAGMTAAISLLTQAAASMWPHTAGFSPAAPVSNAVPPAAPAVPRSGLVVQPPQSAPAATAPVGGAPRAQAVSTPALGPMPPKPIVVTAQPSFVGRTANAGMAFLGKLLLLTGMAVALGQPVLIDRATRALDAGKWHVDRSVEPLLRSGVPLGVPLVLLLLGSLLLVAARRQHGAWHFVRGCVGCVALLWGALVAMLWGGPALLWLFSGRDPRDLATAPDLAPTVAFGLVPLGLGALLLLWPRRPADRPIVI